MTMAQATMSSISQLLAPFDDAGLILILVIVAVLFFEALIVLSAFLATLPDRRRTRGPGPR
jgi:hypothetical protein